MVVEISLFWVCKLLKNYQAILDTLEKEKTNNTLKGDLIKSSFITSTMGVSYKIQLGKNNFAKGLLGSIAQSKQ